MGPEIFTLILAPATIVVLAALVVLAVKIASKRFAGREQQLLNQIASERSSQRSQASPALRPKSQRSRDEGELREALEEIANVAKRTVEATETREAMERNRHKPEAEN